MFSVKRILSHKDNNDSMPQVYGVRKTCDDLKNMIIEPFSYVFCAGRKEYYESNRDGRKGEPMGAPEPTVIEFTSSSDSPEPMEES